MLLPFNFYKNSVFYMLHCINYCNRHQLDSHINNQLNIRCTPEDEVRETGLEGLLSKIIADNCPNVEEVQEAHRTPKSMSRNDLHHNTLHS